MASSRRRRAACGRRKPQEHKHGAKSLQAKSPSSCLVDDADAKQAQVTAPGPSPPKVAALLPVIARQQAFAEAVKVNEAKLKPLLPAAIVSKVQLQPNNSPRHVPGSKWEFWDVPCAPDRSAADIKDLGPIGKGSFGEVHLVEINDQSFAMKVAYRSELENNHSDPTARLSPVRECEMGQELRKIDCPFLNPLYAAWCTPAAFYLLFEACLTDLFELLMSQPRQGCFDEDTTKFIAVETLAGLKSLHRGRICHGDVQLENMLVARDGHIQLADFGSARHLSDDDCAARRSKDCQNLGFAISKMLTRLDITDEGDESPAGIIHKELSLKGASDVAIGLCQGLRRRNQSIRLGYPEGAEAVMAHDFFSSVDWKQVEEKMLPLPALIQAARPAGKYM